MDDTTKRVLAFMALLLLEKCGDLSLGETWTLHNICKGDFSSFEDNGKEVIGNG